MKKTLFALFCVCCALCFAACGTTDDGIGWIPPDVDSSSSSSNDSSSNNNGWKPPFVIPEDSSSDSSEEIVAR